MAARYAQACRRARGRQGRCAPLTRWPEDGPSLTATVRAGTRRVRVGAEGWCRSNKRIGRELVSTGGLAQLSQLGEKSEQYQGRHSESLHYTTLAGRRAI